MAIFRASSILRLFLGLSFWVAGTSLPLAAQAKAKKIVVVKSRVVRKKPAAKKKIMSKVLFDNKITSLQLKMSTAKALADSLMSRLQLQTLDRRYPIQMDSGRNIKKISTLTARQMIRDQMPQDLDTLQGLLQERADLRADLIKLATHTLVRNDDGRLENPLNDVALRERVQRESNPTLRFETLEMMRSVQNLKSLIIKSAR